MWNGTTLTWLGHATYLLRTGAGRTILIDAWLESNPSCPVAYYDVDPDLVLITHGHFDHIDDIFSLAERSEAPIVGIFDLTTWLEHNGVAEERLVGVNKGARIKRDDLGVEIVMVDARHSSSKWVDGQNVYLGEAAGYVVHVDGGPSIYFAGDTCVFGDMRLIAELEAPDVAVLPIGDLFTMGPRDAAHAVRLTKCRAIVPGHWGTFDALTGTPDQLRAELEAIGVSAEVLALEPGESAGSKS